MEQKKKINSYVTATHKVSIKVQEGLYETTT